MSWEYKKKVSEKSSLKLKRGDSLHQNQSEVVAVNQPLAQKWLLCVSPFKKNNNSELHFLDLWLWNSYIFLWKQDYMVKKLKFLNLMKAQIITSPKNDIQKITQTKPVMWTFSQLPYKKSVVIKGWLLCSDMKTIEYCGLLLWLGKIRILKVF